MASLNVRRRGMGSPEPTQGDASNRFQKATRDPVACAPGLLAARGCPVRPCAVPHAIGHKTAKERVKPRFCRPVRNYRLVRQDG